MPFLIGTIGDRSLQVSIEKPKLLIGRGAGNDLDLMDKSVSRHHAELINDAGRLSIRDLGSTNGTWVNDCRITETTVIQVGDRVRFGQVALRVASTLVPEIEIHAASDAIPRDISKQDSLSWNQAREDCTGSHLNLMLWKVVTEAGQLLVLPRPLHETFDLVLEMVERVVPVRRALLLLTDTPDGSPAIRAAHPRDAVQQERWVLSQTIVRTVLEDCEAMILNDVLSDPRFAWHESIIAQNLRSAMVAPLFDNQQVIGLLYADTDDPRTRFDRDQLRAFTLLANLVAVKITNARLLEAQREKERMEREVAAAAGVQHALLRADLPRLEGYDLAVRQVPCFEVGGDLYDITPLEDGRVAFVVGDVMGKGMSAALLMSNVLAGLRVLYQENLSPVELAERIDRELLHSSDEFHYATLFLGLLDPRAHTVDYVNAGHNPPMLFSGADCLNTLSSTGVPLGLLAGSRFAAGRVVIPPHGLLCVFSDGVTEAAAGEELFGEERLQSVLCARRNDSLEQMADGILDELSRFAGGEPQSDDVTLLLLRRKAQASS
ncbi:MAG: SpoIIE family protein phosphatase [Candidatus Eisenbacteria bacterium]|nr:SpoIIE family protein phosphatase [Candidatus Eisenbacteria bacterium]